MYSEFRSSLLGAVIYVIFGVEDVYTMVRSPKEQNNGKYKYGKCNNPKRPLIRPDSVAYLSRPILALIHQIINKAPSEVT